MAEKPINRRYSRSATKMNPFKKISLASPRLPEFTSPPQGDSGDRVDLESIVLSGSGDLEIISYAASDELGAAINRVNAGVVCSYSTHLAGSGDA